MSKMGCMTSVTCVYSCNTVWPLVAIAGPTRVPTVSHVTDLQIVPRVKNNGQRIILVGVL